MTLRKRVNLLEDKHSGRASAGPNVAFICGADDEARTALRIGGDALSRHDGETESAFMARASDGAGPHVFLPGNARDALAHPDAPNWAKPALIIRALQQKHAS